MAPGRALRTPLIEDAFINFECRLMSVTEAGDHTIFVGQVLAAHMGDVPGPLVNFGGGRYALARPAGG
jgi:flavin reductase (DIM6/NTAB) family NADH-FMN oxidoreductase RutF